jgi:Zn-dependent peptidase ImmA (M78 family)
LPNKKYIVSIDEEMIKGRKNWTIAHELGHIILKHFIEFDIDNLTDEENDILDREAEIFAREILMPREWVKSYCEHPLIISVLAKLKNLFDVSWQAITFRLDELNLYSKDFILSLHEARKVEKESLIHFEACDQELINDNLSTSEKRSVKEMDSIKTVQVDENFRFLTCPFCDNTDFSPDAKFCKRCGSELFNYCTNTSDNDSYRDWCGRPNVQMHFIVSIAENLQELAKPQIVISLINKQL